MVVGSPPNNFIPGITGNESGIESWHKYRKTQCSQTNCFGFMKAPALFLVLQLWQSSGGKIQHTLLMGVRQAKIFWIHIGPFRNQGESNISKDKFALLAWFLWPVCSRAGMSLKYFYWNPYILKTTNSLMKTYL